MELPGGYKVRSYGDGLMMIKATNRTSGRCLFFSVVELDGVEVLTALLAYKKESSDAPLHLLTPLGIEWLEVDMKDEKDYLDELIDESCQDSAFATAWEPIALMHGLVRARVEQGLSQEEVARRMGIHRARVADLEKNPARVSFGRIVSYSQAVGATLAIQPSEPAEPRIRQRGRPLGSGSTRAGKDSPQGKRSA